MENKYLENFINSIVEIRMKTTHRFEASSADNAINKIKACSIETAENTVKKVRDELFYHKGPLYDSPDQREEMKALRTQAYESSKKVINYYIKLRRGKS